MKEDSLAVFEDYKIRRVYDEESETWYFSVVDIIQVLIQQPEYQVARNYWKVLKNRLNKEGSETVTKCNRLKLVAEDGKMRLTDVADPETLLRLIQSVPSPKAEPIKLWLARVGYERMQDMGEKNGEYVVKLKAGMETGVNGLTAELIASQLATFFDIPTPEPAII